MSTLKKNLGAMDIILQFKEELEDKAYRLTGKRIKFYVKNCGVEAINQQLYADFCEKFCLNPKSREGEHLVYRQVFAYLLISHYGLSSSNIGRLMGCDHSTILHSKRVIEDDLKYKKERVDEVLENVRRFLNDHV